MKKITVAIDGYSSCGKSTVAKELARAVGYTYVDTGAMYRAVTLFCLEQGLIGDEGVNEKVLKEKLPGVAIEFRKDTVTQRACTHLNGRNVEDEIRSLRVASQVSKVAAIGFVRERLVAMQQEMGRNKGVVMDGRDIGTTVFPDAELKIFMTASPEIRAQRRYDEMKEKGVDPMPAFEAVLQNVKERDHIDETRPVSPLRKAEDAVVLDNGNITREQQRNIIMDLFRQRTA